MQFVSNILSGMTEINFQDDSLILLDDFFFFFTLKKIRKLIN